MQILTIQGLSSKVPSSAFFVGSGSIPAATSESTLKVMEVTAGKIPTLWDSTLGFRNCPNGTISNGTAIYVLRSEEKHATEYEADSVEELRIQLPETTAMTNGEEANFLTKSIGSSAWDSCLYVMPAQLASVVWSYRLDLDLDDAFMGQSTLRSVISSVQPLPIEPVD